MSSQLHARTTNVTPATDAERRARYLDMLHEMAELAMALARDAVAKPPADPAKAPPLRDASLAFARATSAARQAIALAARLASADQPPASRSRPAPQRPARDPAVPPDPRRPLIREALHQAAEAEPDRTARAALRREIDEHIEHELAADPQAEIPIPELLVSVSEKLGLRLDPSRLSDRVLGLEHPRPPQLTPANAAASEPWPNRFHQRE